MKHLKLNSWRRGIATLLGIAALCSCMGDTRQLSFATPNATGWAMGDTLTWVIDTLKAKGESGIELLLQTDGYTYSNIALHICLMQDSTILYNAPMNIALSEATPTHGLAQRCDYTVPIGNIDLTDSTHTTIRMVHQMSDTLLKGISRIGFRIGSPARRPGEVVWQVEW